MDPTTIRSIFDDYRTSLNQARDESLEEATRAQAADAVMDLRVKLDEALVQDKEDRDAEDLLAAVEAREASARLLSAVKSASQPVSGFPAEMRDFATGKTNHVHFDMPWEARTTTDMTTSDTTAYGSRTIPQTWADRVWMFEIAQSGVLQAGPTIINTTNANQINTPTLTTDFAGVMKRTEGSATTDSSYPVIGTVPLNGYPLSGWVSISDELIRDSGVSMETFLARLAGRGVGALLGSYLGDIDIGTGSSTIAAITVGVTSAATCASQTAVTVDELITLYQAVLPAYRVGGSFIANSAVTLSTMLAKDGEGHYLWAPAVAAGAPETFLGKPWFEDAYFDASASGNIPVVFGDVAAAYVVRFVGGLQIDWSRDYQFPSFESTMRFQQVVDAATMDPIAVKGLTLA